MINKTFKWKHKYWYCVLFSNLLAVAGLALHVILRKKNIIGSPDSNLSLILMVCFSCVIMCLFLIYLYKTTKEARLCKSIVKPIRNKYLQWGCIGSFALINSYLITSFVSYKINQDVPIYIGIPLTMLSGLASTVFLTIYEFCFAFDVFYHKNKHEIIHDFLKNIEPPKPVKVEESVSSDEPENVNETSVAS